MNRLAAAIDGGGDADKVVSALSYCIEPPPFALLVILSTFYCLFFPRLNISNI